MTPSPGGRPAPETGLAPAGAWPTQSSRDLAERWKNALLHPTDPKRAARGLELSRTGAVTDLRLTSDTRVGEPAHADATVHGSGPLPFHVRIGFPPLPAAQWAHLLTQTRARTQKNPQALGTGAHGLVHSLLEAAADHGLDLLPAADALTPGCTCPDRTPMCDHVIAVLHHIATTIETDPLVLPVLRGHTRAGLSPYIRTRVVRQRRTARAPDIPADHTPATVAFARPVAPLPELPEPTEAEALLQPALLAADMYHDDDQPTPNPDDLLLLSTDAAQRARTLLNTLLAGADYPDAADPAANLDRRTDAIRYAAGHRLTPDQRSNLSRSQRWTPDDLNEQATAWRSTGQDGLALS
ncbi:hypothetical protein [Streptomyces venezuelae]|uniref:SWIM zinc finger family protein n=1 Tax=Streptomyces venezuelae TaxID=54571 RepID=UPI003442A54A